MRILKAIPLMGIVVFMSCIMYWGTTASKSKLPEPIGGYGSVMKHLVYPEKAWEAGIEGTVIVQAYVDSTGAVVKTVILKGIRGTGMNEAAETAIAKTHWNPARQGRKSVGVWVSVPVMFRLDNLEPPSPVGGYSSVEENVVYPESALAAGIEGTVVVRCYVDGTGEVLETTILRGIPNSGLGEAAEEAIRKTPFQPASYQNEALGAWLDVSFTYRILGHAEQRTFSVEVREVRK